MKQPTATARERIVDEHVRTEVAHDLEGLVSTFDSAAEWRDLAGNETHSGHEGIRRLYAELFGGFPDFSLDVRRKHVASDAIILEVVATGTHNGVWKGIPATGRRVTFPICAIFTFSVNDKLTAEVVYYDRMTVLTQLGIMS